MKAGVFKDFQVVLLSRSLLNLLRTFASLIRSSFFRVWENFVTPPGNSTIIFLPRGKKLDKKICPGGRD